MPRPPTPNLTPYTHQLPDVNNPATWAEGTPLFWTWVTGPGFNNLDDLLGYSEDAIDFIDAALAGSETLVNAVAAIQTGFLPKSGNLAGLLNTTTALTNLGGTTTGRAVFTAASQAGARAALGATTVGASVFTVTSPEAGRAALDGQLLLTNVTGIEQGQALSGNRSVFHDFHASDDSGDFSARILRLAGAHGGFQITNTGTGSLDLVNPDGAVRAVSGIFNQVLTPSLNTNFTVDENSYARRGTIKTFVDGTIAAQVPALLSEIGVGQTWQDVTASRSSGTNYQNTTGKPIEVSVTTNGVSGNHELRVGPSNPATVRASQSGLAAGMISTNRAIVPHGHWYRYLGNINSWQELR